MGFTLDTSDFEKGFKKIVEDAVPPDAAKGLFEAGNELLRDAIYKQPFAPFDEGHLRGSARTEKVQVTRGEISILCGFNIAYAARWHELTPSEDKRINWTLPGSGAKYLESKMNMYRRKYMEIVAERIKRGSGV